ncbi:MAG: GNAT family N-acetyltransferase [Aphanocapsa lilacina HA4352-LM1]|jgi:ribosomal protein S18 acetylase RimI-like enzyme|nr:GNAT family N-acetyltransferase [Aphanocapsa lilacina HA4352-LM1]
MTKTKAAVTVANLHLRRGTPGDAPACGAIAYEAFRGIATAHNFPPDFPSVEFAVGILSYLLARKDIYPVVAEVDGRVVGSNFLWESAPVAGIGPIAVDPAIQSAAVGRRLMEHVLGRVEEGRFAGVRLVQSAYNLRSFSLYAKLGFAVREPLVALAGPALDIAVEGYGVRPMAEADLSACNRLCRRVHGFERCQDLLDGIAQGTAMVVGHDGRITGCASGLNFFGHAVGESNDDLKALIGAAGEFEIPGFLLPTRNAELLQWCLHRGLRISQPLTLMSQGLYSEPAAPFLPSILY